MWSPSNIFLSIVLILLTQCCAASWETIHKQSPQAAGSLTQPSIRYGHGAERHNDKLIMTLGYFYDRDRGFATWMSDTWEMDMMPPYTWQRVDAGISQEHAQSAYSGGRAPHGPAGRFGHSTAVHNDSLYLYGGHDGGISRHGRQNYEPGYDFDELWSFSVPARSWRLHASPAEGPGKRYLHASTVIGDQLLIYGGLSEGQGDVWSFGLKTGAWQRMSGEVTRLDDGPGRRVGHSITAVDHPAGAGSVAARTQGFLLTGGRYIDTDGSSALDSALFFFDLADRAWRRVSIAAGSASPSGRKYHAEASAWVRVSDDGTPISILPDLTGAKTGGTWSDWLSGKPAKAAAPEDVAAARYIHVTVMAGGTITTPGLTCTGEAWLATLDCGATEATWQRLPDLVTPVYDARGAASSTSGSFFMFGGHFCSETKGDAPFYYTNAVTKLNLINAGIKLPAGSCHVNATGLPLQRGQGEAAMGPQEL